MFEQLDAVSVTGVVLHAVSVFILCPLIVYFLVQFTKIRHEKVCKYRVVWLCQLNNGVVLIGLVLEPSYILITRVLVAVELPSWIGFLILSITWWAAMSLFAIKVYHLHYEQQCNVSIAKMSMAKLAPNNNDWYILNRGRVGNPYWTLRIAFVPYIAFCVVGSLCPLLFEDDERLILFVENTVLSVFPIGVSVLMLRKTGSLRDIYGIRDEIGIQCIGFIVAFFLFVVPGAFFTFHHGEERMEWLFCIPQSQMTAVSVAIVSTAFPVHRHWSTATTNKMRQHIEDHDRQHVAGGSPSSSPSHSPRSRQMSTFSNATALKWVIADSVAYQQFMEYLITEFSTENLLFITELIQIKYHFQRKNEWLIRVPKASVLKAVHPLTAKSKEAERPTATLQDDQSDHNDNQRYQTLDFHDQSEDKTCWTFLFHDGHKIMQKLTIPLNIPTTALLTEHDDLFGQMHGLYAKYVATDSAYEINISYQLRFGITSFFDDEDGTLKRWKQKGEDYKLFNLFDEPCLAILRLMQQSMYRFRMKEDAVEEVDFPRMQSEHEHDVPDAVLGAPDSPQMRHASSYHSLRDKYKNGCVRHE